MIKVTLFSKHTATCKEFDTDNASEAITEFASKWYAECGEDLPRRGDPHVWGLVIERDGEFLTEVEKGVEVETAGKHRASIASLHGEN